MGKPVNYITHYLLFPLTLHCILILKVYILKISWGGGGGGGGMPPDPPRLCACTHTSE